MTKIFEKVNFEDISQIIIGPAVMAVPVAFSEELWKFGERLPLINIVLLLGISLFIQFFYTQFSIFQGKEKRIIIISSRVILNYLLTFTTVVIILFTLNRLSFTSNYLVGL
jgi:uncharacterized membrane protein